MFIDKLLVYTKEKKKKTICAKACSVTSRQYQGEKKIEKKNAVS